MGESKASGGSSSKENGQRLKSSGPVDIKDITKEASYRDANAILRQMLRGDESKGDAGDRDVAGATDFEDTPHGREETKNNKAGAANQNG